MERIEIRDNFKFLKEYEPSLYAGIKRVECKVKTDPHSAVTELRQTFEDFVNILMNKYGLSKNSPRGRKDIFECVNEISGKAAFYHNNVNYITVHGEKASCGRLHFLRLLLNAGVHSNDAASAKWPKVDAINAMKAVRALHLLTRRVYIGKEADKGAVIEFREDYCPIGNFYIYDSYVPYDNRYSSCRREYRGVNLDSTGNEIASYAIIREYDAIDDEDLIFRLRNEKCFNTASKYSIEPVPSGMVSTSAIKTVGEVYSYFICYSFNREPHSFTNRILKEMTPDQKLECCKIITRCLDQLHNSDVPIYHRLLNGGSIYVCRIQKRWIPFITKFDCAKIATGNPEETVGPEWLKAQQRQDKKIKPYQPPECKENIDFDEIDWAKVDVYSLGMLFANIYSEDLEQTDWDPRILKANGCSDEMIALIDDMTSDMRIARPSLSEVMEHLK